MKKLLLLILFVLNLVLLQAQKVEFISVNEADTALENITYKSLQKHLQKDSLTADTLTTPEKWMVKLQKKLTKEQRQDSNIYIFFCPTSKDSLKAFLPLSGKYGYVIFDSSKVGVVELEKWQKRLLTHKYQWDLIHDPQNMLFAWAQDEEEGAAINLDILIAATNASDNGLIWSSTEAITCITPAGKPFTLPNNIKTLDFTSATEVFPDGALINFTTTDGKFYSSMFNRANKEFKGYIEIKYPNAALDKDKYDYIDNEKTKPAFLTDNITKTLTNESRVLLGKKINCAINVYQIDYSEVKNKTGISDTGYNGSGTYSDAPLAYNIEGKTAVTVGDNTACLGKYAKEFYTGHKSASSPYKETLLRIANLLSSIEGGGDAMFTDYEKYCNKEGSRRYYGNPDLWGTPEDYELFEKALEAYINKKDDLEKLILSCDKEKRDKLTDLTWLLIDRYSESISYNVRLHILKILSTGAMYGNDFFGNGQEYLAIRLIAGIKDKAEQTKLLADLLEDNLLETLFNRIGDAYGDDNFSTFIMLIAELARSNTETYGIQGQPLFLFDSDFIRSDKVVVKFTTNCSIELQGFTKEVKCSPTYYAGSSTCVTSWVSTTEKYTVSPYTFIPVKFPHGDKYLKTVSEDGTDIAFVPAIYLKALNAKRNTDVTQTTAGIVVDAGLLCLGVGELNAAIKAYKVTSKAWQAIRVVVLATDVAVTSTDLIVSILEEEIQHLEGGKEFLDAYNTYSALIGLTAFGGDILTDSPETLKKLSNTWHKLKSSFKGDPKKVINAVGGVAQYNEINKTIEKSDGIIKKVTGVESTKSLDVDAKFDEAIAKISSDWKENALGKRIDELDEAPLGYYLSPKENPQWIKRKDASDPRTPQLTVENGVIVPKFKYADNLTGVAKGTHQTLIGAGVRHIDDGTTIKYLTKEGAEFAKIENGTVVVSKSKGEIPVPEKLYTQSFINAHEEKFKSEGAGFIIVKSWIEEGQFSAMPPRKFVGLQSEMDEIIKKYKSSGNDWKVLRDELNLGAKTNLEGEVIYYVKIDGNDPRFKFELPNGNEGYPSNTAGAIVGEWMPGGKTKNGTSEAVLVGSETIVHNKKVTQLLDNFKDGWTQIQ